MKLCMYAFTKGRQSTRVISKMWVMLHHIYNFLKENSLDIILDVHVGLLPQVIFVIKITAISFFLIGTPFC